MINYIFHREQCTSSSKDNSKTSTLYTGKYKLIIVFK